MLDLKVSYIPGKLHKKKLQHTREYYDAKKHAPMMIAGAKAVAEFIDSLKAGTLELELELELE